MFENTFMPIISCEKYTLHQNKLAFNLAMVFEMKTG
jgi:hypothetical protein